MKIGGFILSLTSISAFLNNVESFHRATRSRILSLGQRKSTNQICNSNWRSDVGSRGYGGMYMHLGHSHSHHHHHDHEEHDPHDFVTHDINRNMPQDGPSSGRFICLFVCIYVCKFVCFYTASDISLLNTLL